MSSVILLSFNYTTPQRVVRFANDVVACGIDVDLVVADPRRVELLELEHQVDPRVRVHHVLGREILPIRAEQFLLFRIPGGLLTRLRKVTGKGRADQVLEAMERAHRRVAGAFHQRVFMLFLRQVRPLVLARRFRSLPNVDAARASRIVAGDVSAIPLGWRLARRYPQAVATTSLDASPFKEARAHLP